MKAIGVRNIDALGRVCLPIEIRRNMGLEDGKPAPMEMLVADNGDLLLRKYEPGCHACGESGGELRTVGNVRLCEKCVKALGCGDGCGCKKPAKAN